MTKILAIKSIDCIVFSSPLNMKVDKYNKLLPILYIVVIIFTYVPENYETLKRGWNFRIFTKKYQGIYTLHNNSKLNMDDFSLF